MSHQPTVKLVMQNGPQPGQVFTIYNQPQVIGRGEGCQIVITDKTLSRKHARVRATAEGLLLEDLGSTNGTFINEQKLSGKVLLRTGDTIRLGDNVTLNVQVEPSVYDETVVGSGSAGFDQTMVPPTPATVRPTATPAPTSRAGTNPWIWVGIAVIIAALIVGGALAYLYYLSTAQTPAPTEVALPPTDTPVSEATPEDTPVNEATPTPTFEPINVPGLAAIVAQKQSMPADVINKVSPFCNKEIEVLADEPVIITWERQLAEADSSANYLDNWLASASYDLTLDGRPVTTLHYEQAAGPTLNWWANVGLLPPGKHYLRLQWYTNRPLSNGLDVEPADGQMDTFGPGPAGEGYCEVIVPQEISAATSTPAPTFTPAPTPTPTKPSTQSQVSTSAAPLGIFQNFENPGTWKRGDQPYGEFTRSSGQVHSGSYAGQLSYNFPSPDNDYVVFVQSRALAGQPNAISAWVYGDGSGHFLNVWIKDANNQTWAMSFGQVNHNGWQEMIAYIDPSQPWPSGHISGPDNGVIDYPISFQALVLDDGNDNYTGSGTIYIDDLNSQETTIPSQPTAPQVGAPAAPAQSVPANTGPYILSLGNQHRYEEPWGAPRGGNPCRAWENNDWDDEHPNYRGFNVELLLTNNSANKVRDDWGEDMTFFTTGGEVTACYYGYSGAGPAPGGTTSLTFFSVVPQGDFVQRMRLDLDGQVMQICLDGRGGWSRCN